MFWALLVIHVGLHTVIMPYEKLYPFSEILVNGLRLYYEFSSFISFCILISKCKCKFDFANK